MTIEIRRIAEGEFERTDALVTLAYTHDYGARDVDERPDPARASRYRAERFDVFIAADPATGELLGSITSRRPGGPSIVEDTRDDEIDVRLLAVSPSARRLGIASLLVSEVERLAAANGYSGVFLKSAPGMLGAHALYERLGYIRDRDRDGLIVGDTRLFDLYAFTKRLT